MFIAEGLGKAGVTENRKRKQTRDVVTSRMRIRVHIRIRMRIRVHIRMHILTQDQQTKAHLSKTTKQRTAG